MSETAMSKALVFTLLRHAEDFPWRMQDTVCQRNEARWRSGQARDATRQEIKSMAAKALDRF